MAGTLTSKVHLSDYANSGETDRPSDSDGTTTTTTMARRPAIGRLPSERRQWGSVIIDRRASRQEVDSLLQLNCELEERVSSLEYQQKLPIQHDMELAARVAKLAGSDLDP